MVHRSRDAAAHLRPSDRLEKTRAVGATGRHRAGHRNPGVYQLMSHVERQDIVSLHELSISAQLRGRALRRISIELQVAVGRYRDRHAPGSRGARGGMTIGAGVGAERIDCDAAPYQAPERIDDGWVIDDTQAVA